MIYKFRFKNYLWLISLWF